MTDEFPAVPGAFLEEPTRPAWPLRLGIWLAERSTGRKMLPARILAWNARVALGAGVLESLAAHGHSSLEKRRLKLVRLAASFATACPFCIDMNSAGAVADGISAAEYECLARAGDARSLPSFSPAEVLLIEYTRAISGSPLKITPTMVGGLREFYSEREIVTCAATAAQVNYWARLIQALGIPPAGFWNAQT